MTNSKHIAFLAGVDPTLHHNTLNQYFRKNFQGIQELKRRLNKKQGFLLLQFCTKTNLQAFLDLKMIKIFERNVIVTPYVTGSERKAQKLQLQRRKLFIKNLPDYWTTEILFEKFSNITDIEQAYVVKKKARTSESQHLTTTQVRSFGLVITEDERMARYLASMKIWNFDGVRVTIEADRSMTKTLPIANYQDVRPKHPAYHVSSNNFERRKSKKYGSRTSICEAIESENTLQKQNLNFRCYSPESTHHFTHNNIPCIYGPNTHTSSCNNSNNQFLRFRSRSPNLEKMGYSKKEQTNYDYRNISPKGGRWNAVSTDWHQGLHTQNYYHSQLRTHESIQNKNYEHTQGISRNHKIDFKSHLKHMNLLNISKNHYNQNLRINQYKM